jgi:hypothetical protein
VICPTAKAKYFFRSDWTASEVICPSGRLVGLAQLTDCTTVIWIFRFDASHRPGMTACEFRSLICRASKLRSLLATG